MIREGILEDPLIVESYQQAPELTWVGRWLGKPYLEVSWFVEDRALAQKIGQKGIFCQISELLWYHCAEHGIEEVAISLEQRLDESLSRRLFYEHFQRLANLTGKNIVTYGQKDGGEEDYLFRVEPGLTVETRFARLKTLRDRAAGILSADSNVAAVWSFGSLQKGNLYARDVDLGIVVREKLPEREEKSFYSSPICCLNPRLHVQESPRSRSVPELASSYLNPKTTQQMEVLAVASGIKLDGHIFTQDFFENPGCCRSHQRFASEIKKGTLLFSR